MIQRPGLRRLALVFSLAFIFWMIVPESHAQSPGAAPGKGGGAGGKKTSINFEDQLVEGQAQKPELFYLLQQRNNNFKRLIRLRENFLPEMRKTSEDVGRAGGGSGKGPND